MRERSPLQAGPARERPHPVLAEKALVTDHGSAPGGAAPLAATRQRADVAIKDRMSEAQ